MTAFLFVHGREMAWVCISICTLDTLVNASVLFTVSRHTPDEAEFNQLD